MCSKANALPSERVIERDASMRVACNSALAWMLELLSSVVSLSLFFYISLVDAFHMESDEPRHTAI
uniref:Uncharacterized protein n=1 Tax=Ascaris lumbricoides TaxID=6252 RepID=A0A0M3I8J7_ASCLU